MLIDMFLVELYKSHIENASPYPQETTRPTYWAGRVFSVFGNSQNKYEILFQKKVRPIRDLQPP